MCSKHVRTPEDRGCVGLRVATEDVDAALEPEPLDERLDGSDEPSRDEELRVRMRRREQRRERLERELEPVGLRLVAAEEQDGPVLGQRCSAGVKRPTSTALWSTSQDPAGLADPLVRRPLAELALVEDVLGRREQPPKRAVDVPPSPRPPSPGTRRRPG